MRGGGFTLIVIILIVLAGIYYWSGNANRQSETPLEVLDAMELDTEIAFLSPIDAEFTWQVDGADGLEGTTVSGKQIEADELIMDERDLIANFLEARGFKVDIPNVTAGTIVDSTGYTKGNLVCIVKTGVSGGEAGTTADPVLYYAKVSCGELEEESEVTKTDEELIADVFAAKYNMDASAIEVIMERETGKFASGMVQFGDGPDGGGWLAFNGDSGWELVYDGNGSVPCADVESYDFPTDMVPECVDAQGALVQLT